MCRLTTGQTHDIDRALFSNPADRGGRTNLTVRVSYDDFRTWPESRVLHESATACSDLCVCDDDYICCPYERGEVAKGCQRFVQGVLSYTIQNAAHSKLSGP